MSARFNRTVSSSLSFPTRLPNRALGTVVILSIMSREALFKPLRSVGSMSMRSNGASVGSVVNTLQSFSRNGNPIDAYFYRFRNMQSVEVVESLAAWGD